MNTIGIRFSDHSPPCEKAGASDMPPNFPMPALSRLKRFARECCR
jgi:hypothetical protein